MPTTRYPPRAWTHPLQHGIPPKWASAWGERITQHGLSGAHLRSATSSSAFGASLPAFSGWGRRRTRKGGFRPEGPRHLEAVIDSGFWMFDDTPCTLALWEAVMGENPSQFKVAGASRASARVIVPQVEMVSWDQCQGIS